MSKKIQKLPKPSKTAYFSSIKWGTTAKRKISVYVLTEICHQRYKWLGPKPSSQVSICNIPFPFQIGIANPFPFFFRPCAPSTILVPKDAIFKINCKKLQNLPPNYYYIWWFLCIRFGSFHHYEKAQPIVKSNCAANSY